MRTEGKFQPEAIGDILAGGNPDGRQGQRFRPGFVSHPLVV